jgi:hypothetical protein
MRFLFHSSTLSFIFSFLFSLCIHSQNPGLIWAKSVGSATFDIGRGITTDNVNNVYVTGYFGGTADFDPGPGVANLVSNGAFDMFFAKYDSNGNYIWARSVGSSTTDIGTSISLDASGNIYITGYFDVTPDFDPGPGIATLSSTIGVTFFLAKYDNNGNYLWAKGFGNGNSNFVKVDPSGNPVMTGYFYNSVDFDPGPGVTSFTSVASYDMFLAKYDPSGNLTWADQLGGPYDEQGSSLAYDAGGNIWLAGSFGSTLDMNPGPGVNNLQTQGGPDGFIAMYDPAGNYILAKNIGGNGGDAVNSIATDAAGNVYVCGDFDYTIDLDPGPGLYTINAGNSFDGFFAKYDPAGNFTYGKAIQGVTGIQLAKRIAVDGGGNVFVAGEFTNVADLDPGPGVTSFSTGTSTDMYLGKYDQFGNYVWALQVYSPSSTDRCYGLALDACGNVLMTGFYRNTADFDPTTAVYNITSVGIEDMFFAKFTPYPLSASASSTLACQAQPLTLSASGGPGNTYTWNPGNLPGQSVVVNPTVSTVYTVVSTSTAGCSLSNTVQVTVGGSSPTVSVSGGTTICAGQSATLTATGATSYTWSNSANTPSIVVSPTVTSTYTVYGTTLTNTCASINTVTVVFSICTALAVHATGENLSVYPDPSNGEFAIRWQNATSDTYDITITDISGRVVHREKMDQPSSHHIHLTDCKAGIYILTLRGKEHTLARKLVVY